MLILAFIKNVLILETGFMIRVTNTQWLGDVFELLNILQILCGRCHRVYTVNMLCLHSVLKLSDVCETGLPERC